MELHLIKENESGLKRKVNSLLLRNMCDDGIYVIARSGEEPLHRCQVGLEIELNKDLACKLAPHMLHRIGLLGAANALHEKRLSIAPHAKKGRRPENWSQGVGTGAKRRAPSSAPTCKLKRVYLAPRVSRPYTKPAFARAIRPASRMSYGVVWYT